MRNLIIVLLFSSTIIHSSIIAQSAEFTIAGLTDEVYNSLNDGEYVKYTKFANKDDGAVFFITAKNPDSKDKNSQNIDANIMKGSDGKYNFKAKFKVPMGNVDVTKDIELTIYAKTTFRNQVWTKRVVKPDEFSKPIYLDKHCYSIQYQNNKREDIYYNIALPPKYKPFYKEVTAAGDDFKKLEKSDFHIQIKNKGDVNWKLDQNPAEGTIVKFGSGLEHKLYKNLIDPNKDVIFRISMLSKNGKYLWAEKELKPWELGGTIEPDKYSKEEFAGSEYNEKAAPENNNASNVQKETAAPIAKPASISKPVDSPNQLSGRPGNAEAKPARQKTRPGSTTNQKVRGGATSTPK